MFRQVDARLLKKSFEKLAIKIKAAGNLNNNFSRLYIMMFRSKGIHPLT